MTIKSYDYIIVGGGIFGAYAALYLTKLGMRVCIIEKEKELLKKATIINQARLHSGYHYPRSIATARMSDDNKARFIADHKEFILFDFEKYYAIDRFGSLTDSVQFERFCRFLKIKCNRISKHPLFNFSRLEALYETVEYSFDPYLIAEYYREHVLDNKNIDIKLYSKIIETEELNDRWKVVVMDLETGTHENYLAGAAINATYSGSNAINRLFGVADIELMHEISEMVFVTSEKLRNVGLTVMDGQFGSIMPYGLSDILSVSSVAYTHQKVSYDNLPHFDCQRENTECKPDFYGNCNDCFAKPKSNYRKMIKQMSKYFADDVKMDYYTSLFTIKSKLKASYIDDGRPTEISKLHESPDYYCIFAGKVNSIYEIEKFIKK